MRTALALLLAAVASGAVAAEVALDLSIKHGRLTGGTRVIRVKQGDSVKLRWRSDRPITLHLHGYDIEIKVEPGVVKELAFEAYATGRFPVHVHGQAAGSQAHEDAPLVYVEVYPR
ncbi:MAG: hypothetical protein ACLQJR_27305 [Stellaceae bacterium]